MRFSRRVPIRRDFFVYSAFDVKRQAAKGQLFVNPYNYTGHSSTAHLSEVFFNFQVFEFLSEQNCVFRRIFFRNVSIVFTDNIAVGHAGQSNFKERLIRVPAD